MLGKICLSVCLCLSVAVCLSVCSFLVSVNVGVQSRPLVLIFGLMVIQIIVSLFRNERVRKFPRPVAHLGGSGATYIKLHTHVG